MPSERIAPRRPWLAGLLQLFMPGLGNVYSGRRVRGLVIHVLGQVAWFAALLILLWLPAPLNLLIPLLIAVGFVIFVVIDGVRCARAAIPGYRLARYNRWYVYVLIAIVVPLIEIPLTPDKHIAQAYMASTASMEPTVFAGEHLFVNKLAYAFSEPLRGDLAVYQQPDDKVFFTSRIIGLPGETIEIRERVVFINGRKLDEPYAHFERDPGSGLPGDTMDALVIPPGAYFVMGDSRDNSNDSRFSGPIRREQIVGKAGPIYFSREYETRNIRWNRIGKVLN
jgi:signal peptidase I